MGRWHEALGDWTNGVEQMMRIVLVGLNYRTAPVEVRERFSFSDDALRDGLRRLSAGRWVDECLILSTCNRVEIYAVSPDAEGCVNEITQFLSEYHGASAAAHSFESYMSVSFDEGAINHILRVASSLDSMVIGEPQILGQVKEAYRIASSAGTTGLILNRLLRGAFSVAKRVRAETKIGSQAVSVSYAAVQLAKRIFDDLSKRSVMLVGAGDMAELALKHIAKEGIRELIVANRTLESASALAHRYGGRAIKMEEIHYSLKDTDILIAATGSMDFVIKPQHVREALTLRRNEPVFMIDIAVPRDIDPRVGEIPNIYLYDIDDLEAVMEENMKTRRKHAERAEEIVREGEKNFRSWLDGLRVVPAIISLRSRFEEIQKIELGKAIRRLQGLSEGERRAVEALASGIVAKILYKPMTNLKKESSSSLGALYVDTLKRLFELEGDVNLPEENDSDNEPNAKNWD
ncbi:MAG: glutamyl-tRNA reductase [Deltaproteobacteria bacterium]